MKGSLLILLIFAVEACLTLGFVPAHGSCHCLAVRPSLKLYSSRIDRINSRSGPGKSSNVESGRSLLGRKRISSGSTSVSRTTTSPPKVVSPSLNKPKELTKTKTTKNDGPGDKESPIFRKMTSSSSSVDDDTQALDFVKIADEERLQKVLARAGITSRRGAEQLILDGRVVVNGKIATELGTKVKPRVDIISVDGKRVTLPDSKSVFWVMLHKPKSVISSVEDDKDRDTVTNLVPRAKELRLLPVGRMERDSTGLMLLTNDNGWIHPLTHPSFQHKTRYEVVVQGLPSDADLELLRSGGGKLDGDTVPLAPCTIEVIDTDRVSGLVLLDVRLTETRPMLLQRLMEMINRPLISLKRTEFGPLALKGLRKGQWRELTKSEVESIKKSCRDQAIQMGVRAKTAAKRRDNGDDSVGNDGNDDDDGDSDSEGRRSEQGRRRRRKVKLLKKEGWGWARRRALLGIQSQGSNDNRSRRGGSGREKERGDKKITRRSRGGGGGSGVARDDAEGW